MASKKIRIIFADDHELVRTGIRTLFQSTPDCVLVAEAEHGEQAIRLIAKHKPDVAILDISMPKLNGIEVTRMIKEQYPNVKILILTMYEDEGYVNELINAGVNGYVLKTADKEEILSAVRTVAAGVPFFGPTISKLMVEKFIKKTAGQEQLTKREIEVLRLVAEGLTSREIANKLFVSLNTVNSHRTNIMKKLDIHDTAGLVKYALQNGLMKADS